MKKQSSQSSLTILMKNFSIKEQPWPVKMYRTVNKIECDEYNNNHMQHKERFEKSMKEHSTAGFIKSTDHRPLIHRPTDPPATDSPTHRRSNYI